MIGSSVSDAAAAAARLGTPTTALEDWRYVRVDSLQAALEAPRRVGAPELAPWLPAEAPSFVVVDGQFHHLGRADLPGVWGFRMMEAADQVRSAATLATTTELPTVWALTGPCQQVLAVRGDAGVPLTIVNAATGGPSGWTLRCDLAPGARLHLVIRHAALGKARSAFRLEADLARGAHLTVEEIQATSATILTSQADVTLAQDSQVTWTSCWTGGDLVRQRLDATLRGAGASLDYAGLADTASTAQAHVVTRVRHAAPNTSSRQLIKTVLADASRTSLDSVIAVDPGADGTDADLQNRNLILSPLARADTRPQLDIRADEVKAAHGATIGRLDADEMLYLRMRGFSETEATATLSHGWRDEVRARLSR